MIKVDAWHTGWQAGLYPVVFYFVIAFQIKNFGFINLNKSEQSIVII